MQTGNDGGDERASGPGSTEAKRLLDHPDGLGSNAEIYRNGIHVANLRGRDGGRLHRAEYRDADTFGYYVVGYCELRWTHAGALMLMQGATVLDVLGPRLVMLEAEHRPQHHPIPGAENVVLGAVASASCVVDPKAVFHHYMTRRAALPREG